MGKGSLKKAGAGAGAVKDHCCMMCGDTATKGTKETCNTSGYWASGKQEKQKKESFNSDWILSSAVGKSEKWNKIKYSHQ